LFDSVFSARSFAWDASNLACAESSPICFDKRFKRDTSWSDFAASQNSINNPNTRSKAESLFALASLPSISFQSQATSPITPSNTNSKPGCLNVNPTQSEINDEARIINQYQKDTGEVLNVIWAMVVILFISFILRGLFKK